MKWLTLYNKIGKQLIKNTRDSDVVVLIKGNEIPLGLKFKVNGTPYLVPKDNKPNAIDFFR